MTTLYEHIRAKNSAGLRYDEAVQLFLWIFSTADFLPAVFRHSPPDKYELIETFDKLSQEGLITKPDNVLGYGRFDEPGTKSPWAGLIKALLAERVELDPSFPSRVGKYL